MRNSFVVFVATVIPMLCGNTAPAAVRMTKPETRLNDDGAWQVLVKVWFLDGTWDWGYLRWTGVEGQIDWSTAVVCRLQGTGVGFAPEPKVNLIGSRLEFCWPAMRSTR